mgnify:CR=1 FL=1
MTYYGTDLEHVTRQEYDQKVKEVRLAQFTEDQIPEISDELLQQYSNIVSREKERGLLLQLMSQMASDRDLSQRANIADIQEYVDLLYDDDVYKIKGS